MNLKLRCSCLFVVGVSFATIVVYILYAQFNTSGVFANGEIDDLASLGISRLNFDGIRDPQSNYSKIKHCKVYASDSASILKEDFPCEWIQTVPPAIVCMYPPEKDLISDEAVRYGIWEPYVSRHLLDVLLTDRELGYIDIGANLGMHAIPVAAMKRPVIAVEPSIDNIRRIHKSLHLNNIVPYLTIVANVVTDNRDNISLHMDRGGKNIGGKTILEPWHARPQVGETIQAIHMDDLLEVIHFKKAVLKIDIEGAEPQAFKYAQKLFRQVDIHYVFMEWGVCRNHYLTLNRAGEKGVQEMKAMVDFFYDNDYRPTWPLAAIGGRTLQRNDWLTWPWDIVWIKKHMLFTNNFVFNFYMLMLPGL